jgi:hypothetical protein
LIASSTIVARGKPSSSYSSSSTSEPFDLDKFLKIATASAVGIPGDFALASAVGIVVPGDFPGTSAVGRPGDSPVVVESGEATSTSFVVEATTRGRVGVDLFWVMIFRRSARERADVLVTLAEEPRCFKRLEDRFGGICSAG